MNRGKMQQPTKQELRDRIVYLTLRNETLEIEKKRGYESCAFDSLITSIKIWKKRAHNATIAAYALLVTLFLIVLFEVIL